VLIGILACGVITVVLLVFMCARNARKLNTTAKHSMNSSVGNVRLIPKTVVFRSDHRRTLRSEDNDNFINPDVTLSRHDIMRSPQMTVLTAGNSNVGTYSAFRNTAHEVQHSSPAVLSVCDESVGVAPDVIVSPVVERAVPSYYHYESGIDEQTVAALGGMRRLSTNRGVPPLGDVIRRP